MSSEPGNRNQLSESHSGAEDARQDAQAAGVAAPEPAGKRAESQPLAALTLPLLLEVGCEEIPARFLEQAHNDLAERLAANLATARLLEWQPTGPLAELGPNAVSRAMVQKFHTPRRLAAFVPKVLVRQADLVEEITGPPARLAFDTEGKPTRAAESFAAKNGVKVQELLQVETPKGAYLSARRTTLGRAAAEVLTEILPSVITGMTFPKSMVWESCGTRFVRPVRWLVALLGEGDAAHVVPFEIAGVRAGNVTYCHRLARRPRLAVNDLKDYINKLHRGRVEIDPAGRRRRIRQGIRKLLTGSGANLNVTPATEGLEQPQASAERQPLSRETGSPDGDLRTPSRSSGPRLIADPGLEDWIVASTEWPTPILGSFEPRFLELPREILITVMRDHQKYFALEDGQGVAIGSQPRGEREAGLAPLFIAVLNVPRDPEGIIRRGHERVLTARLEDARFFWHADQKIPLGERVAMLERVTYQAKLGEQSSYAAKISRMKAIAEQLCASLEAQGRLGAAQRANVLRAVELCKCDLTTQMVQEFTELQGVVGGLYAKTEGEPEEVWQAIYDHYKPVNIEDACPRSVVGAVVSLADKLDAVVTGFSVGLEPTGSSDPFGLRRAGNGIVKLYAETFAGLSFSWEGVRGSENLDESFFRERLDFYLHSLGLRYDSIRAVLNDQTPLGWRVPSEVAGRARALEQVRGTEDFQALAAAAKRTRNILSKSAKAEDYAGANGVKPEWFQAAEERELYAAYEAARSELDACQARSDYAAGFRRLAKLRPAVDRFFDKVMVMDEDRQVRANRLRLLTELDALAFRRFADLAEVET